MTPNAAENIAGAHAPRVEQNRVRVHMQSIGGRQTRRLRQPDSFATHT